MVTSGSLIKLKGSYREPKSDDELQAERREAELAEERADMYQCAWCDRWSSRDQIEEAPDARGCSCKCDYCRKLSWTGIGQGQWFPKYRNGMCGEGGHF